MSMPAPITSPWTPERVRQELLREDQPWPRYELVDGVLLVTPAPRFDHQRLVRALYDRLTTYVRQHRVGELCWSPADISLDDRSIVQPDLFLVPPGQSWPGSIWTDVKGLALAVEVLSPGSARHDRGAKRDHYQRHGVPEYWIVDGDARLVERWRPETDRPEILRERLVWHPESAAEALAIDLPALFAEALGAG